MSEQSGYVYNCPQCFATTPKACTCGKRASDIASDAGFYCGPEAVATKKRTDDFRSWVDVGEIVGATTYDARGEELEYLVRTGLVNEVRVTDPVTGGEKGDKLQRMDLLPWDALMKVSEHYAKGAEKYEDRNWERGYKWHLTAAAALRHFAAWWQREEQDEEGNDHLDAFVFHALALRTFSLRGIGTDDRP